MPETNLSISVSSLKKSYKTKSVLNGLHFSVPAGSIFALLGSNGAGKTTTIRLLTAQSRPDSGSIRIQGYDPEKDPLEVRKRISLTGQFSAVDESLTGKENLIIMGELRHLTSPKKEAEKLLSYFDLLSCADQVVSSYSGGMKRKLDIAMSLLGEPQVLFLDEPTTGLDPQSRRNMWDVIRKLNHSGVTIFLTTQYLEEAEELADTIAILDQGKIIAQGSSAELKALLPQGVVRFTFENNFLTQKASSVLHTFKTSASEKEHLLTVFTDGAADTLGEIFHLLRQAQISITDFSQLEPNLEDVFLFILKERNFLYENNL